MLRSWLMALTASVVILGVAELLIFWMASLR
jgi:hypothetical protein